MMVVMTSLAQKPTLSELLSSREILLLSPHMDDAMLSASSLSLDGLSRRQRGRTDEDEDSGVQNRAASSTPTPAHETEDAPAPDSPAQRSSDDPLLASGEIQFEWRG